MKGPNQAPEESPDQSDPIGPAVEAADRLIKLVREGRSQREESGAKGGEESSFPAPVRARRQLEAAEEDFRAGWEHDDNGASGRNQAQTFAKLEKLGIHAPPTEADMEAAEQERLAGLRAEVAANQKPVKPPRKTVTGRSHPSIRPGVRAQSGYDKEQDPSNPRLFP